MNYVKRKTSKNLAMISAIITSIAALGGVYHYNNTMAATMVNVPAETPTIVESTTDSECGLTIITDDSEETDTYDYLYNYIDAMHDVLDTMDYTVKREQMVTRIKTAKSCMAYTLDVFNKLHVRELNYDPNNITEISGMNANEFNTLIDKIIDHRGLTSNNKLYNTGEAFEYIEKEYNINGIYVLAIFTYESAFAERCINTNNFAGLKGRSGYKSFNSPSDCIYYEGQLLRNSYVNKGFVSLSAIGSKYCETNAWADEVGDVIDIYLDYMEEVV